MTVLVRAVNVARFSGVYCCLEKGEKKTLDEHEERPIKHFFIEKRKSATSFSRALFLGFDE